MSEIRKKTVLRTIRLTREIDRQLQEDAEANGMTVNGLMNRIITKYAEWDRHTERFGFISIASQTFRSILEEVDESKIEQIATGTASKILEAVALFWFKKLNLETVLKTASNHGKYSGVYSTEIKVDETKCTMAFHHDLGGKWSIFLKCVISRFIKTALGTVSETKVTDDLVLVSFYTHHQTPKNE